MQYILISFTDILTPTISLFEKILSHKVSPLGINVKTNYVTKPPQLQLLWYVLARSNILQSKICLSIANRTKSLKNEFSFF
jgi:hypothetical protein